MFLVRLPSVLDASKEPFRGVASRRHVSYPSTAARHCKTPRLSELGRGAPALVFEPRRHAQARLNTAVSPIARARCDFSSVRRVSAREAHTSLEQALPLW